METRIDKAFSEKPRFQSYHHTPNNVDKPVYFVAVRFKHWDQYPEIYKTAPDDMSIRLYRTWKSMEDGARRWIELGHKVLVGEFSLRRLIETSASELKS